MDRRTFLEMAVLSTLPVVYSTGRAMEAQNQWHAANGPLRTRWTKEVSPSNVWSEYPRPGMVRKRWQNLNGLWEYAVRNIPAHDRDSPPQVFDGTILVPFGIESQLSGVMKPFLPDQQLWYKRTFNVSEFWQQSRILLHFDAVDFEAKAWLNGKLLGEHKGGYDRFSFDITDLLNWSEDQELLVSVLDPTNEGNQACGKQSLHPQGASYTATSGIWQTVWLEPVSQVSIASLMIVPDIDGSLLRLKVTARGGQGAETVEAVALDGQHMVSKTIGRINEELALHITNPRTWSPDNPFLYDLRVRLKPTPGHDEGAGDEVASYFGMRKFSLGKGSQGEDRLFLNGKPVFLQGPLDQGFWPDGVYTAANDDALKFDLDYMKAVGFNAVRKHVKVEPDRWYYWADKLGLLVWQDMPSGLLKTPESRTQWELELTRHVANHFNCPSIVMWVLFNEGWGQYDTERLIVKLRGLDATRLLDNASGWYDKRWGDVVDAHFYPGPLICNPEEKRAVVAGEFGGLGYVALGHMWSNKAWGYLTSKTRASLSLEYQRLWQRVHRFGREKGLSAAIYTQISDVETEADGLLTYDRAVEKIPRRMINAANRDELPQLKYATILPLSQEQPQRWAYTIAKPADDWAMPSFDASNWRTGEGGFGTPYGLPDKVKTKWNTNNLWVRREFHVASEGVHWPLITAYYGVDFEVYINGVLACKPEGFHNGYGLYELNPDARVTIHPGKNIIAIHFIQRNKGGQQYADVGLMDEMRS